jgi:beta-mannosidase
VDGIEEEICARNLFITLGLRYTLNAVWHGTQEKYQLYGDLGGRFNSEFGMEAFPHLETIKYFVTDTAELFPQSRMLDFHNKADGHERRIGTYLVENFQTKTDLKVCNTIS